MNDDQQWWQADIYVLTQWATDYPHLWPNIAEHPNCTPQLREWIYQQMQAAAPAAPVVPISGEDVPDVGSSATETGAEQVVDPEPVAPPQSAQDATYDTATSYPTQEFTPAEPPTEPISEAGGRYYYQAAPSSQQPAQEHPTVLDTPATYQSAPLQEKPATSSGNKHALVIAVLVAIALLLGAGIGYSTLWKGREKPAAPTPVATASSAPTPSATPSATATHTPTPAHPDGWDDIEKWDFANSPLDVAWIFQRGRTKAENVQLQNGRGTGENSTIQLSGTPVFADANGDGYLDAFINISSDAPSRGGLETRSYLMIWDPATKQPKQLPWYVAEQGKCMGTITSVEPAEQGFKITGTLPSRIDPCSSAQNIDFTRVIGAEGNYPMRLDKRGWGGMCAADLNSTTNLLHSGLKPETIQLAPQAGSPNATSFLSGQPLNAAYEAVWYDGNTVRIDGFKQVLIASGNETGTSDLACAFIPE